MALTEPVSGLFTEEWDRFLKGVRQLDPDSAAALKNDFDRQRALNSGPATITMPSWDEIIKLPGRLQPTTAEISEYYTARRERREPNLAGPVTREMDRRVSVVQRIRTSVQPGYQQGFGNILTALDNVQDFTSTLSSLGRVSVWGLTRGLDFIAPGATQAVARDLARAAAVEARFAAAAGFDAMLKQLAAAGDAAAQALLRNPAALAAEKAVAIRAAESIAARAAFRAALLGLGARLAGRFIPIVGWLLLASDLLNLLSFLGQVMSPVYAFLCAGPTAALAAGVPAAVFKRALKSETWRMHSLNPFSRQSRTTRALKAARGLPGFGALIEAAQTTEQLFGWGLTLGGLVGKFQEEVYSILDPGTAAGVRAQSSAEAQEAARRQRERWNSLSPYERRLYQDAARVMGEAPWVLAAQETYTDEEHLLTGVAVMEAIALTYHFLKGQEWQDLFAERTTRTYRPVVRLEPATRATTDFFGLHPDADPRFPMPGSPRELTGSEYAAHLSAAIPQAVREFLAPRRNTGAGAFYGALVNQTTEYAFYLFEEDPELLRWELTTDARLISGMVEDGFLADGTQAEGPAWAMWQEARQALEASGRTSLPAGFWPAAAERHGVRLIRLLPPEAPWPPEWSEIANQGAEAPPG